MADAPGSPPGNDGTDAEPSSAGVPAVDRRAPQSITRGRPADGPEAKPWRPPRPALPDRPGRWQLTKPDGSVVVHRVIDRNGQLYVVRGRVLSVAVPIAHFEGVWVALG
jgi:hypothetical protein